MQSSETRLLVYLYAHDQWRFATLYAFLFAVFCATSGLSFFLGHTVCIPPSGLDYLLYPSVCGKKNFLKVSLLVLVFVALDIGYFFDAVHHLLWQT